MVPFHDLWIDGGETEKRPPCPQPVIEPAKIMEDISGTRHEVMQAPRSLPIGMHKGLVEYRGDGDRSGQDLVGHQNFGPEIV